VADIERTCPQCGKLVTISSVAERFVCPACGTAVSVPQAPAPKTGEAKTRLRIRDEAASFQENADEASPPRKGFSRFRAKDKPIPSRPTVRRGVAHVVTAHHVGSWLVFLAIGGVMAGMRYGGWLNESQMDTLRLISPILLLVLYVITLMTIFSDSVFAGIMSLLIPPYSLYYLLVSSDRFLLRAVVIGILVGIGQFSADFITYHWMSIVSAVHAYIASGG